MNGRGVDLGAGDSDLPGGFERGWLNRQRDLAVVCRGLDPVVRHRWRCEQPLTGGGGLLLRGEVGGGP